MKIEVVPSSPIDGQMPGTSGLRRKTRIFMQPNYLENFIQAVFSAIGGGDGKCFVVGGDGRYFNAEAIQIIIRMAAANGVARLIVGREGLLSTPAASHLIRLNGTDGGLILSASHNPGGIDGDFGVKFNISNGGSAPANLTDRIFDATRVIESYRIADFGDVDLSRIGRVSRGDMVIEIVDPVADYLELMERIFDFDAIRDLIAGGFTMRFDAMHGVSGPYAHAILEGSLGASEGTVINGIPKPDFGGSPPDPNPIWARSLMDLMMSDDAPDFGAASDGDGDRNMILGRGIYVAPSDSLAVLVANAHLVPAHASGLVGVARSLPTSAACDRVAESLGIGTYVAPTGWKFFGNLLDAGKVTICGEESAGTGSSHIREKDGLWAVLFWLNILAKCRLSVAEIMSDHWCCYGRDYYSRHDFESLEVETADALADGLRDRLAGLPGQSFAGVKVIAADEFTYTDPVDGSVSANQGICVRFEGGGRAVFRLSGTGTQGATLRIYLEQYESVDGDHTKDPQDALETVRNAAYEICRLRVHLGRSEPDVQT